MNAILCSFSGGIAEMPARDQADPQRVLQVLHRCPRFSAFDATERPAIARSLDSLKHQGLLVYPQPQPGYPWCFVELTAAGLAALPAGLRASPTTAPSS